MGHPYELGPSCSLQNPCHLDAGGDPELAEDIAEMGLDGLEAQEELRRDLGVGATVQHKPCHLEVAAAQRAEALPVRLGCRAAARDVAAELAKLVLGLVPV